MAIGIPVFILARQEEIRQKNLQEEVFTVYERRCAILLIIAAIGAALLAAGQTPSVEKHFHKWAKEIAREVQ